MTILACFFILVGMNQTGCFNLPVKRYRYAYYSAIRFQPGFSVKWYTANNLLLSVNICLKKEMLPKSVHSIRKAENFCSFANARFSKFFRQCSF